MIRQEAPAARRRRGERVELTPDIIVDTFLSLLEDHAACSLRELSGRLGCSHANIYNHFKDWRDLRWAALAEVLRREVTVLEAPVPPEESSYLTMLRRHVGFALAHPAWFHLVWKEEMESAPAPELAEALARPAKLARQALALEWPAVVAAHPEADQIIHEIVHGGLMLMLHGRSPHADTASFAAAIEGHALAVLAGLST